VTFWLTVAGMVAVTFGSRYAGLVTPSLEGELGEDEIRIAAAFVTGLAAWRTRNLGIAIAAGMLAFWALRWVSP